MGALTSRSDPESEDMDSTFSNAFRYPPKTGSYFGSHFIMGGERFEMSQPESYLFGDNSDLNFLGCKPVPFPYPTPTGNEPTRPLRSLVNIRKDSLRLVKVDDAEKSLDDTEKSGMQRPRYNIEFTFDSDARCAISIYYFATEDIVNNNVVYHTRDTAMNSETFHYKRGANQLFSQSTHIMDPSKYSDDEWLYDPGKETIPIVISCVVEDEEHPVHSHITYAVVEKSSADGGYIIKPLKQKQFVEGVLYLLQEIYGIENKQTDRSKLDPDDEVEDSGAECVICMSDMRDTLILPCRHLCLCSTCAESLRYQASSCPICRSPFRALLQIRAMRKKQQVTTVQTGGETGEENVVSQEGVPQGYEAVSLIEAVNGPCNQLFTDGGLQYPVRIPPDVDTGHREKKRSSKRHLINVKTEENVVNPSVTLKPDDKKVLDEEEEERKKSNPLEVVRMECLETNKEELDLTEQFDKKDTTDDSNSSKIVNVSGDYSSDTTDTKDTSSHHMSVELKVYESEPESDYELKPVELTHDQQTSTENLADDEREDTSDGEVEPEPDYDDEDDEEDVTYNVRTRDESSVRKSDKRKSTLSDGPPAHVGKAMVYMKDCSQSAGNVNSEGYQHLNVSSSTSLHGNTTSSTEGSSCGSSQGLLPDSALTDDDK